MQTAAAGSCFLLLMGIAAAGTLPRIARGQIQTDAATNAVEEESHFADWPFVRGPTYDGHSTERGIVDSFPPEGPPVLWTRSLGVGYSAITVQGNRAYTQYQTLGGQYVICLDADTGSTLWEHRYAAAYDPAGMYPGPRATPTLSRESVFFASPDGTVGCLDSNSGGEQWAFNVFERFEVEPVEFGYSCSPVVVGDTVLLPVGRPQASMVALHAATGVLLWRSGDDPISHVPAYPIEWRGRPLVVGYLRNTLNVFDRATGEIVRRITRSTAYDEHAAWPLYREPYLWISGPFQAGSELIELVDDAPGYRTVWKSRILSNDVCSSVLVNDHLYGFDLRDAQTKLHRPSRGQFRCIEFLSGEPAWINGSLTQRVDLDEPTPPAANGPLSDRPIGHASVIAADGKLILFNDRGELILLRTNPAECQELGRGSVLGGEICWTAPSLAGGRLFVRNHSRVACLLISKQAEARKLMASLRVKDIPQTPYRDWAALLLPVEPDFAMDLPTLKDVWLWYKVSATAYVASAIAAWFAWVLIGVVARRTRRNAKKSPLNACSDPATADNAGPDASCALRVRQTHALLAFSCGATGTIWISLWLSQFVFTWPVCLFVALQAAVYASGNRSATNRRWGNRFALIAFLGSCLLYYVLCRRLNLAFEWVFLSGFIVGLPLLAAARRVARRPTTSIVVETFLLTAAFTAYFWGSVAVMAWKYGTQSM